jgi:3-phenylpropionate/trans-cinnamate dioxygenase ferredoxin reductase subunit
MSNTIVTVGAGQSAAVAVRTLRRRSAHDGPIVMLGDEQYVPYQRPPLSKEYLAGEQEAEETFLLSEQWCADNNVELRLGTRVARIDIAGRRVELDDGTGVDADLVLLAPGSRARRLPGVEGDRILYLRTLDDAVALRSRLRPGARVICVGAGFIGSEIASVAIGAGAEVVTLEAFDTPLERALGQQMGQVCAQLQRDNGVDLRCGELVDSITETADGVRVRTQSGMNVEGDVVVIGIGTVPNTEVAERSGIGVDNGILVDEYCRTNVAEVFAAGDVTNHWHPLFQTRMRVEHFDNANKQSAAAAKNMVGKQTVFDDPHWFWSDQHGLNLQHCGFAEGFDDLVVRGSLPERDFIAFYLRKGAVRAAFAVERGGDMFVAKQLVSTAATPAPERLRDESVELAELLAD